MRKSHPQTEWHPEEGHTCTEHPERHKALSPELSRKGRPRRRVTDTYAADRGRAPAPTRPSSVSGGFLPYSSSKVCCPARLGPPPACSGSAGRAGRCGGAPSSSAWPGPATPAPPPGPPAPASPRRQGPTSPGLAGPPPPRTPALTGQAVPPPHRRRPGPALRRRAPHLPAVAAGLRAQREAAGGCSRLRALHRERSGRLAAPHRALPAAARLPGPALRRAPPRPPPRPCSQVRPPRPAWSPGRRLCLGAGLPAVRSTRSELSGDGDSGVVAWGTLRGRGEGRGRGGLQTPPPSGPLSGLLSRTLAPGGEGHPQGPGRRGPLGVPRDSRDKHLCSQALLSPTPPPSCIRKTPITALSP